MISSIKEKEAYMRQAKKYPVDNMRRYKWYGVTEEDFDDIDKFFVDTIPCQAKVLEVGCGGGRLAKKIYQEKKVLSYRGIDIVDLNIMECKKLGLDGFEFCVDNYWRAMTDSMCDFDFIISQGVLFSSTDVQYTDLLFQLLDSVAVKGFVVMAANYNKMTGISKDDTLRLMNGAISKSVNIKDFSCNERQKVKLPPLLFNKIFWITRDGTNEAQPEISDELKILKSQDSFF